MLGDLYDSDDDEYKFSGKPDSNRPVDAPFESYYDTLAESRHVGLANQGATCYLNSLFQTLNNTYEFRDGLFQLDDEELALDVYEYGKDEARANPDLIDHLERDMGIPRGKAAAALKLHNNNVQNALNAIFNGEVEDVEEVVIDEPKKRKPRKIPIEIQRLFAELQMSEARAISTERVTWSFGWKRNQAGIQHDVHELNRVLLDATQRSLKKTSQETLVEDLFSAHLRNATFCEECKTISTRDEVYYDIGVTVEGHPDLLDGLAANVSPIPLTGSDKYFCSICGKKTNAVRRTVYLDSPPILTFNLMRFVYDRRTWDRVKLHTSFPFPLTLDFSPYLESNLKDIAEFTAADAESEHEKIQAAEEASRRQREEEEDEFEFKENTLFYPEYNEESENLYDLYSVVIHSGSAHGGHYYAYIRDSIGEGKSNPECEATNLSMFQEIYGDDKTVEDLPDTFQNWFCYNDSSVLSVSLKDVLEGYGGSRSGSGYMLVYRQCSSKLKSRNDMKIPERLVQEVQARNLVLQEERELYLKQKNALKITLFPETGLAILDDGTLTEVGAETIDIEVDRRDPEETLWLELEKKGLSDFRGVNSLKIISILEKRTYTDFKIGRHILVSGSEPRAIYETGIHHGCRLLLWDGIHINGTVYVEKKEEVSSECIKIHYFPDSALFEKDANGMIVPQIFNLELDENTPFSRFVEELSLLTGVHQDDLFIQTLIGTYIKDISKSYPTDTLEDLEIDEESTIYVESRAISDGISNESIGYQYNEQIESLRNYRIYYLEDEKENQRRKIINVTLSRYQTVFEMKMKALEILFGEINYDLESFRFRQILFGNPDHKSLLLYDENTELQSLRFEDIEEIDVDGYLLLENESLPDENKDVELLVNLTVENENDFAYQNWPILVPSQIPLHEVKAFLLQLAGCDSDPVRSKTDDKSSSKYCMNEHLPLSTLKIGNGMYIWMEKGTLPKRDMIVVAFFKYTPPPFTLVDGLNLLHDPNSVRYEEGMLSGDIEELFTERVDKTWTLLELKQFLYTTSFFKDIQPQRLIIRLFNKKKLGRLLSADNRQLKAKGNSLNKDVALCVTIGDELLHDVSPHAMLLRGIVGRPHPPEYVENQRIQLADLRKAQIEQKIEENMHNDEKDNANGKVDSDVALDLEEDILETLRMQPPFPVDFVFDGKVCPRTETLKDRVSELVELRSDRFGLFIWVWGEKIWRLITDEKDDVDENKDSDEKNKSSEVESPKGPKSKGKKKGKQKDIGLRGKPFCLRESHILLIVPLEEEEVDTDFDTSDWNPPAVLSRRRLKGNDGFDMYINARGPEVGIVIDVDDF